MSLKIKSTTLLLWTLTNFSKIGEIKAKISENVNKNNGNRFHIHKNLNIDNSF